MRNNKIVIVKLDFEGDIFYSVADYIGVNSEMGGGGLFWQVSEVFDTIDH